MNYSFLKLLFRLITVPLFLYSTLLLNCAFATVRMVPGGYSTIQLAVQASNDGDTILLQPGIYVEQAIIFQRAIHLAGMFLITHDTNRIEQTVISCPTVAPIDSVQSVVKVTNTTKFMMTGLTLRNGRGSDVDQHGRQGGGLFSSADTTVVEYCRFMNNHVGGSGGGASIYSPMVFLFDCVFDSNETYGAESSGGGARISSQVTACSRNTFHNNVTSRFGGGLMLSDGYPEVTNCRFTNNVCSVSGGGIRTSVESIYFENNFVAENRAELGGGCFFSTYGNPASSVVESNVIVNNTATDSYGGLFASGGGLDGQWSVRFNTIQDNIAASTGGGTYFQVGSYYIENNLIQGNRATAISACYIFMAAVEFTNNRVYFNHGSASIQRFIWGVPLIQNNDFVGNSGTLRRDGLYDSTQCTWRDRLIVINNYWGSPTGPTCVDNPNGTGDTIAAGVPFLPFLTEPVFPESRIVEPYQSESHSGFQSQIQYTISPNPFNAKTTIRYTLAKSAGVRLTVYDCNGRVVMQTKREHQIAGSHSFDFRGDQCSSGIYFCRIDANETHTIAKLVLLR